MKARDAEVRDVVRTGSFPRRLVKGQLDLIGFLALDGPLLTKVGTVGGMERYVKVKALNDVDQDVHYRGSATPDKTLCGMQTTLAAVDGAVTCYRCHQFAVGDL